MNVVDQIQNLRKAGAFARRNDIGVLEIKGPDSCAYLQTRVSNDVKALQVADGQWNSLLSRTANVLSYFLLFRVDQETFWIVVDTAQTAKILQQLETYHFSENVTFANISDNYQFELIAGPLAWAVLHHIDSKFPPKTETIRCGSISIEGGAARVLSLPIYGEDGYLLAFPRGEAAGIAALETNAAARKLGEISDEALDIARIEAGHPLYGVDFSEEELLPDTGLEQVAASYSKGCFLGQEVLARIKTYSAPRKGLVGLVFDPSQSGLDAVTYGAAFSIGNRPAGVIKSVCDSPTLGKRIALAYVSREYRVPNEQYELQFAERTVHATVVSLPFYNAPDPSARAKEIYELALSEFASGSEERSIEMLRHALDFDPVNPDIYESIGVILSRQGQLDEAIDWMKKLAELEPESIMAHANLSMFYMQKGDKETAEEEKAIAMSIRMNQLARQMAAEKQQEAVKAKKREEAAQRMSMFEQVLQIDPDDLLANYGLGTAYADIEEFDKAIPYLQKALEVKPTHTVAYLALGKVFESLERSDEASKIYRKGIDIAAQKGDLTPMKEMQARLHSLEAHTNA